MPEDSTLELFKEKLTGKIPGGDENSLTNSGQNRKIFLESINLDYVQEMHDYSKDPKFYEYFEFSPQISLGETETYLKSLIEREKITNAYPHSKYWFVRRISDRRMIGSIGLTEIDFARKSATWGYGIGPAYWGHGYILELQEILKTFFFEELGLHRLWGVTAINNEPTKSSVLSSGFKHEGILRDYYKFPDGFRDAWLYAMIASDYLGLKEEATMSQTAVASLSKEEIAKIIGETLKIEKPRITDSVDTIPQWDSLNQINIATAIQAYAKVKLSPKEIARAISIENIYLILKDKLKSK